MSNLSLNITTNLTLYHTTIETSKSTKNDKSIFGGIYWIFLVPYSSVCISNSNKGFLFNFLEDFGIFSKNERGCS